MVECLKNIKWKGILCVIGAFLIQITFGTIYCFGNFSPYFTSYLRANGHPDISFEAVMWGATVNLGSQGIFIFLSGLLRPYVNPRILVTVGCFMMSLGVTLTYITIQTSFGLFLLTYGVMNGIGVGLGYAVTQSLVMQWFPDHKGFANGIIVGGFGLGAFIFNQVGTKIVNPKNLKAEDGYFKQDEILEQVPHMCWMLGVIFFVLQFIALLILFVPPKQQNPQVKQIDDEDNDVQISKPYDAADHEPTLKEVVTDPLYILLGLTFFSNIIGMSFISPSYKPFGMQFINDDDFLAMVGSVAAICNSVGRVLWGLMLDKTSYWLSMTIAATGLVIFYATLILNPYGGSAMFMIWIAMIFFLFSSNFVLIPTCVARTFGVHQLSRNYGLIFMSTTVSASLQNVVSQILVKSIGYDGISFIVAAFAAVSLTCSIAFRWFEGRRKKKTREQQPEEMRLRGE